MVIKLTFFHFNTQMNAVILQYEEKLQRSNAQITQLQDQHAGVIARTNANMNAYRRVCTTSIKKFNPILCIFHFSLI